MQIYELTSGKRNLKEYDPSRSPPGTPNYGTGVGEVVTHALSVVAYTCNGIITVDISGVDLASHTGSLY